MIAIGLMSGTSMDAVDVAVVRFPGNGCELLHYCQYHIPEALQRRLKMAGPDLPAAELLELDALIGALFAECALQSISTCGLGLAEVAVIGSHGQTLLHCPQASIRNSLQIGDPNRIAYQTGIRTVADIRRMDMAAGGQGAPLAPAFHAWRFQSDDRTRLVVNIGGIANISVLPPRSHGNVFGFDTGPGNTLLDQWVQLHQGSAFDHNGDWAATGTSNPILLSRLSAEPYFSKPPPKSTGRENFNVHWLESLGGQLLAGMPAADVQATLLELTARTVADAIRAHADDASEIFVCGGGASNSRLMQRLSDLAVPRRLGSTTALGVPPNAVEAMMVAWLAKCRVDGIPANLPSVTGAKREVLLGALYEPTAMKRKA